MFVCIFPVPPVVFVSLVPVTTDRGWVSVFDSATFSSVSVSNVGSILGTISITALVVFLVLSVTSDRDVAVCSQAGSCTSGMFVVFDAMLVVVSVNVTTVCSELSDHSGCFIVSLVLSLASMGLDTGRSGRVSSGSALSVFILFAFGQCLGQCPPSLVCF